MQIGSRYFERVWCVDFEFRAPPGERPKPICLVATELKSGRLLRIWEDDLLGMKKPPYPMDNDALFIAYYASAELGCHLALNWPMPVNVLDLFIEFRSMTNGFPVACGNGLLGALTAFGLNGIDALEKKSMRDLAMRGGPWTLGERAELLAYCRADANALARLFPMMAPQLDIERALLRGRFMKAAAHMEYNGIPVDVELLNLFRDSWESIQDELIARIDDDYGVYDGRTFKSAWFSEWLIDKGIPWPVLPSGYFDLSDDAFREMARAYQEVAPLRELRVSLSQMRLAELSVGSDGRNRTILSAFQARTGRNQPSNSKFIFGPAVWLRGLIRPEPGHGLAYVDWSQQEFGIAAALSGDPLMLDAYCSGDPYLAFAKQAGAVPMDATKSSHGAVRDLFKACALAVQYGMGESSLAGRIGRPAIEARGLLARHRETYRKFWAWSDGAVDHAMLTGRLWTVFGWNIHVGTDPNPRSLRNFPMQANGAEMLRLACCLATERGIKVCAPIHDAILIEAPLDRLEQTVADTQEAMADASSLVLNGFRLRTDAALVRYPDRYRDKRGTRMWEVVQDILVNGRKAVPSITSRAARRRLEKADAIRIRQVRMETSQVTHQTGRGCAGHQG